MLATCTAHLVLLDLIVLIVQSSAASSHFLAHRSKYSPHNIIINYSFIFNLNNAWRYTSIPPLRLNGVVLS
jgi:hypothetical protein